MEHLLLRSSPLPLPLLHRRRPCLLRATSGGNSGDPAPDSPTTTTPPSGDPKPPTSGVKNRLRARNQSRRAVQESSPPASLDITMKSKSPSKRAAAGTATRREEKQRRKEWEEMSLAEKAGELYVGEKGLLFWLNKFAYASIFIMVGAWILFRFVGPSIGLYQLDAPPLAPTDVFTGGSP
uniref:Uncharacterized protein n=1 Tax=Leersia perrieri TaxID=77586 RepID=A0A0D9WU54_9ORYZ